ncbi:hypothetical protein [Streptomyces sp. NBC_00859]|uniref:hypothetical protein n=1 Tax=Streptomyces sp. NBC_00859 TaxID=2903682 RepID=UPI003863E716|nr:hypothetical protein OG584_14720 [Streptomyces sp. NBC_00859]
MPRGRHRHSPPLHRLLQPSAVAGASLLLAVGAWLFADPLVLRCLVAAAAATAVTGAVLMRSWDRIAGRRVAELTRSRAAEEWRSEERTAELEGDLEESRALRVKLETKLRAKRGELAALRGEHAALLRRYATAETERAGALEGRRLLAIEAAAPARAALPAARSALTPAAYAKAAQALGTLSRNAASQRGRRDKQTQRDAAKPEGKPAAADGEHTRPPSALPAPRRLPATAVAPYTPQQGRSPRTVGGFDFFGMQNPQSPQSPQNPQSPQKEKAALALEPAQLASVQNEDLADVVGAEALAAHRAAAAVAGPEAGPDSLGSGLEDGAGIRSDAERGVGQVIDLTEHDETEQIDVGELRTAIS